MESQFIHRVALTAQALKELQSAFQALLQNPPCLNTPCNNSHPSNRLPSAHFHRLEGAVVNPGAPPPPANTEPRQAQLSAPPLPAAYRHRLPFSNNHNYSAPTAEVLPNASDAQHVLLLNYCIAAPARRPGPPRRKVSRRKGPRRKPGVYNATDIFPSFEFHGWTIYVTVRTKEHTLTRFKNDHLWIPRAKRWNRYKQKESS